jgi:hypothetical protein
MRAGDYRSAKEYADNASNTFARLMELIDDEEGNRHRRIESMKVDMNVLSNLLQDDPIRMDGFKYEMRRHLTLNGLIYDIPDDNVRADYSARKIITLFDDAIQRLDKDRKGLKSVYFNNKRVPRCLGRIVAQYYFHDISRQNAFEQLTDLRGRAYEYLAGIGTNPDNPKLPIMVNERQITPLIESTADLYALCSSEDGVIDYSLMLGQLSEEIFQTQLFELVVALHGEEPSAEQLIEAHINAYNTALKNNTELFGFLEDEAKKWLKEYKQKLYDDKEEFFDYVYPFYKSLFFEVGRIGEKNFKIVELKSPEDG